MIPKIIHYCWFGKGKMPKLIIKCVSSWKKYLPDYEFRFWDEDTLDINCIPYVKEAYEAHKFAFVTDYVRLYAIYHYGGIYMDTDVQVLKNFDDLLKLPAFIGYESENEVGTSIIGSEQYGIWVKEQLRYYEGKHFIKPDKTFDMTTNVEIISRTILANDNLLNNRYQFYNELIHIFPKDYFCPKSRSGKLTITPNTYCIHHFVGSWQPTSLKIKKFIFHKLIGPRFTDILVKIKRVVYTINK